MLRYKRHGNAEMYESSTCRSRLWGGFVVTWLILPVVICLFQGLSHACVSLSCPIGKPRMAHYNSYEIIENTIYMDTYGNSRANTWKLTHRPEVWWVFDLKTSWTSRLVDTKYHIGSQNTFSDSSTSLLSYQLPTVG